MSKVYDEDGVELHHGDCLAVMAQMPENSISTIITDPPYELGFMGKAWDRSGIAFRPETWRAALRVAKPGAFLLAFGGTRTWHRLACAIEDAGWELRDTIVYMFGSGFPKSLDIGKAIDKAAGAERPIEGYTSNARPNRAGVASRSLSQLQTVGGAITTPITDAAKLWSGWGTAMKPSWEPVIVAMRPLDGTFAENALKHGLAGLNIDGGRIHTEGSEAREYTVKRLKPGATLNKTGGNWRPDEGGEEYNGTTKAGRWPANLILDESAAALLDSEVGELTSGMIKAGTPQRAARGNVCYGTYSGAATTADTYADSGGPSRFFYTSKASRSDRGHGNTHPTVKPTDLMKYLCKLTATPTGGVVLDPFAGSGTTLVAAREYGRPCIGIELEEDHCRIIVDRLRQGHLFGAAS